MQGGEIDIECFFIYEYGLCCLESFMDSPKIKKWNEAEGLAFIKEIVTILNEVHEKGITQLDINTKNIVID